MKIAINGLGRIGRCVFRLCLRNNIKIAWVNEPRASIENVLYLIKHDSTYGELAESLSLSKNQDCLIAKRDTIPFYHQESPKSLIKEIDKDLMDVVVIDCSGIDLVAEELDNLCREEKIAAAVSSYLPQTFNPPVRVLGTARSYKPLKLEKRLVSGAICDVVALAPIFHHLNSAFKITSASVLSVHPWLSYQNLVDGYISSVASAGHKWTDFSLGRDATTNIIPKNTTMMSVMRHAIDPELCDRLIAMSIRVPTASVTSAYLTIEFEQSPTIEDIHNTLTQNNIEISFEKKVSGDFRQNESSSVIDGYFTQAFGKKSVRCFVWYDNEWGYANHLVKVALDKKR